MYSASCMNTQRTILLLTLLFIAMWLAFDPPQQRSGDDAIAPKSQSSQVESSFTSSSSSIERMNSQPSTLGAPRTNRQQLEDEILHSLSGTVTNQVKNAVKREVENEFSAFLEMLDVDSGRRQSVMEALISAYTEIRMVQGAMQKALISEDAILGLRNPNHVLDRLASHLESDQLNVLEDTLERKSRINFDLASRSQLEASLPQLTNADRELVMDTLFYETYALTSPDGLAMGGMVDHLESQLKALDNAATILSGSMHQQKMEDVSAFLDEKRRALAATAIIFDQ